MRSTVAMPTLLFSTSGVLEMKDLTWPAVVVFIAVLAALVVMFGLAGDVALRNRILGYFDSIVPFIVGAAAGATVGYARGYTRGYASGKLA
jgi:hypothetical protein